MKIYWNAQPIPEVSRRIAVLIAIAMVGVSCTRAPEPAPKIKLTLAAATPTIAAGEQLLVSFTLQNKGTRPVSLVKPYDGSDATVRWRAAALTWAINKIEDPAAQQPMQFPICGNVTPMPVFGEVFILKPGDEMTFQTHVDQLRFEYPVGTYNLTLMYTNDPAANFPHPKTLGPGFDAALKKIRKSTPVRVISNTIQVGVTESMAGN